MTHRKRPARALSPVRAVVMVRLVVGTCLGLAAGCDRGGPAPAPTGQAVAALPAHLVDLAGSEHLVIEPVVPEPRVLLSGSVAGALPEGGWVALPTEPDRRYVAEWSPVALEDGTVAACAGEQAEGVSGEGKGERAATAHMGAWATDLAREVPVPGEGAVAVRVSVRLRTEGLAPGRGSAGGAGFRVVELDASGEALDTRADLPRLWGDTPWRSLSTTLRTGPETRSVRVELTPTRGRFRGTVCVDTVRVELLSEEAAMGGGTPANPGLRAQAHPLVQAVNRLRDTRPALVSPGTGAWAFGVEAVPGARLRYAVARLGTAEGEVCAEVWEARSGTRLGRTCLDEDGPAGWVDQEVILDELPMGVGGGWELHLRSTADAEGLGLAWGDPRVLPPREPGDTRPDLVLFVVDTLRADHLGAYGYTGRETSPALDAFAAESVRYAAAQAPSGWTAPSLGSVMTGLLPSRHRGGQRRVRAWEPKAELDGDEQARRNADYLTLSPRVRTLAEHLRTQGYEATGFVTNNFFGARIRFDRGFNSYRTVSANNALGTRAVVQTVRRWRKGREEAGLGDGDGGAPPQLLVVHLLDPHHPYRAREAVGEGLPELAGLAELLEEERHGGVEARTLRKVSTAARKHPDEVRALYDAEIRWVDRILPRLVAEVDDGRTVLTLLSDHGEGFGEHGRWIHGNTLYEELLHVPLWVKAPGVAPSVVAEPVGLADVMPTLAALAGAPIAGGGGAGGDSGDGAALDGQILPGLGLETASEGSGPRVLLAEAMYQGPDRVALREGNWKWIRTASPSETRTRPLPGRVSAPAPRTLALGDTASEVLYDLSTDPGETRDLAAAHPERAARFRAHALAHLARTTPGLHLRCELAPVDGDSGEDEAAGLRVDLGVDARLARLDRLLVHGADRLYLAQDRHEARLALFGEGARHVVLRTLDPVGELSLTVSAAGGESTESTESTGGSASWTGAPPALEASREVGPCTVWQVGGSAQSVGDMSAEEAEALKALGYLEE